MNKAVLSAVAAGVLSRNLPLALGLGGVLWLLTREPPEVKTDPSVLNILAGFQNIAREKNMG